MNADSGQHSPSYSPLGETPFISIVIPVRNEEAFMEQCIRSLAGLDYPRDGFEVIFADGCSTDRTAEIARAAGHKVVNNPGLKISAGRNDGFAASKGDIVVFTDADCIFDPQWLRRAVARFRARPEIGGLAGPTPTPADQNAFGKAVGIVFDLAGLAGGTVHRSRHGEARLADDLPGCNSFYRREALQTAMPTNTTFFSNEDVLMNACLRKNGVKLLMTPDVSVQHYKRASPRKFWRQMYVFAIGRVQIGRQDPSLLKPIHWLMGFGIPFSIAAIIALLVAMPSLWKWFAGAVVAATLGFTLFYGLRYSLAVAFNALLAAVILKIAWPLGFMRELFFPMRDPSGTKPTSRN